MNIYKSKLFPYVVGDSLVNKTVTVTIKAFTTENLPNHRGESEEKYLLSFQESDKKLVLNKVNAKTIAELYGPETEQWTGKKITLYGEKIKAFGKEHNVVRIAPAAPKNGNGKTRVTEPEAIQGMIVEDEADPETWHRAEDAAING